MKSLHQAAFGESTIFQSQNISFCFLLVIRIAWVNIQNELKYLANLDPHALGQMGVLGNVASLGNYLVGNKVKEYRAPDVSQGGSQKHKKSRKLKKRR